MTFQKTFFFLPFQMQQGFLRRVTHRMHKILSPLYKFLLYIPCFCIKYSSIFLYIPCRFCIYRVGIRCTDFPNIINDEYVIGHRFIYLFTWTREIPVANKDILCMRIYIFNSLLWSITSSDIRCVHNWWICMCFSTLFIDKISLFSTSIFCLCE